MRQNRLVAERAPAADPPDFAAEWKQIRQDLEDEFDGAMRIGQNLITIRDALKPRGLWLSELQKHGMSQPQASRYIRFAELPERDRAIHQRTKGFSLSAAIGESRDKKDAKKPPIAEREGSTVIAEKGADTVVGKAPIAKTGEVAGEIEEHIAGEVAGNLVEEIPADELAERRAETDRRFGLAIQMIEAGEEALTAGPRPPEYADDVERWAETLREVGTDLRTVVNEHLRATLQERLLVGVS